MKKQDLNNIIREEVKTKLKESQGLHDFFYGDDENAPKSQGLNKFREQEYKVGFDYMHGDWEHDTDIVTVTASSEEEALKKAKLQAPRLSKNFKVVN